MAILVNAGGGEVVTPEVTEYEALLETAITNLTNKAFQPPIDPTSDPDLIPENIREGIDIWGIIGSMSEGVSGVDWGEVTLSSSQYSVTCNHNLKQAPSLVMLIAYNSSSANSGYVYGLISTSKSLYQTTSLYGFGLLKNSGSSHSIMLLNECMHTGNETSFTLSMSAYQFGKGNFRWVALV